MNLIQHHLLNKIVHLLLKPLANAFARSKVRIDSTYRNVINVYTYCTHI